MRFSFMLMAMLQSTPIISIVDSLDDPKTAFVVVDQCRVEVKKVDLKNYDAVLEKVNKVCNLGLNKDVK